MGNMKIGERSNVQKLYGTQHTVKGLLVLRSVPKWFVIVNLNTMLIINKIPKI